MRLADLRAVPAFHLCSPRLERLARRASLQGGVSIYYTRIVNAIMTCRLPLSLGAKLSSRLFARAIKAFVGRDSNNGKAQPSNTRARTAVRTAPPSQVVQPSMRTVSPTSASLKASQAGDFPHSFPLLLQRHHMTSRMCLRWGHLGHELLRSYKRLDDCSKHCWCSW